MVIVQISELNMRLKIKCGNHWEVGAGIQGHPWLHSKLEDRQPEIHETVLKKLKKKKTLQIKKETACWRNNSVIKELF